MKNDVEHHAVHRLETPCSTPCIKIIYLYSIMKTPNYDVNDGKTDFKELYIMQIIQNAVLWSFWGGKNKFFNVYDNEFTVF